MSCILSICTGTDSVSVFYLHNGEEFYFSHFKAVVSVSEYLLKYAHCAHFLFLTFTRSDRSCRATRIVIRTRNRCYFTYRKQQFNENVVASDCIVFYTDSAESAYSLIWIIFTYIVLQYIATDLSTITMLSYYSIA